MLRADEFLNQVDEWHSAQLWPNISRYRPNAVSLFAAPLPHNDPAAPYNLGGYWGGGADISPDPALVNDKSLRDTHIVAIFSSAYRAAIRGTHYAYPNGVCDHRPEAEYPDPSVVGTAGNVYTVPAARSGTGVAYTANLYEEETAGRGAVLPIQDYIHCPNYCRRSDCALSNYDDRVNRGPRAGCFRDMDLDGNDPAGRHKFDTPGKRCADGYAREVNVCHFNKVGIVANNGINNIEGLPITYRDPLRPERQVGAGQVYNYQMDGWRWKAHYWTKGIKVRTCAMEAQDRVLGFYQTYPDGHAMECSKSLNATTYVIQDASCGCGPNGSYCQSVVPRYKSLDSLSQARLRTAVEQEPIQIARSVVARDEDYLGVLTTRRSFVNGPLALAWREQANVLRGEGFIGISPPAASNPIWDKVDFADDAWTEYERPEQHAGVMTTLGFLLRFPTYRARIAQYRRAFLCSGEFDYAPQPDPSDTNPDIAKRKGCSDCHARLEFDGLYFGRYPDRQPKFLDPIKYPLTNPYFKSTFPFEDINSMRRIDEGPAAMVRSQANSSTDFEACTVRRVFKQLMRRDASEAEAEAGALRFKQRGRNYRELVRDIVTSAAYQKVQP